MSSSISTSTKRSKSAEEYRQWYKTKAWRELRRKQLRSQPWCAFCLKENKHIVATVCDHVHRHNGDRVRFWNGPFQSLCYSHHDITKQREENLGYSGECDLTGWPVDPSHPANRKE